ncbi:MAG: flagellar basal body rod protein FlgC [FCB group bacterium]|nr:flagellar basal body rod protein FlgC [FCB group bacterium]
MKTGGIFSSLKTTYRGLSSQMKRLEVISENVANAKKLPDKTGKVYRRKEVVDRSSGTGSDGNFKTQFVLQMRRMRENHLPGNTIRNTVGKTLTGDGRPYEVKEVGGERLVYEPDHPEADANGYIHLPDINIIEEMVDMVSASRAYEANVSVINAVKQVAKKTLEI